MNKKIFLIILVISTFNLGAEECYQVGKSKPIPNASSLLMMGEDGNINEDIILIPSAITGIYGGQGIGVGSSEDQDELKYYDRKNDKVVTEKKRASEYPFLMKNGNIVLYDISNSLSNLYEPAEDGTWKIKDEKKYLDELKKTKTTELNPITRKRTEYVGKIFTPTGELLEPQKIETIGTAKYIVGKKADGKEMKMILQAGEHSIGYDQDSNRDFQINDKKLEIIEDGKVIYTSNLEKKYTTTYGGYTSYGGSSNTATPDRKFHFYNLQEINEGSFGGIINYTSYSNTNTGNYLVYDAEAKQHKMINVPSGYNILAKKSNVSKDESKLLLNSMNMNAGVKMLDLKSGETKSITSANLMNPKFFGENKVCGTVYYVSNQFSNGMYFGTSSNLATSEKPRITFDCYDLDGNKVSSKVVTKNTNAFVSALSENEFIVSENSTYAGGMYGGFYGGSPAKLPDSRIIIPREYCPKAIPFEDCNCDLSKSNLSELNSLLGIEVSLLCQNNFDSASWSKIVPVNSNKIDDKTALLWLKKISKPNAFVDKDLDILKTLIENGVHKKYSGEFKAAMLGILATNSQIYEQIITNYPALNDLDSKKIKDDCNTTSEKSLIAEKAREYIKQKLGTINTFSDEELKPLLTLGKNFLNHDQQDKLAEDLADLVVEKMPLDSEVSTLFPSKVYKFAYNNFKKELGLEHKDLSDVTVIRNSDGTLKIMQLGVSAFDGSRKALGGLQLKTLKVINDQTIKGNHVENLSWNYGGKEFSAAINLTKDTNIKDITPSNSAPDYKAMKSKEPFKGLIIAGSNLGQPLTQNLVQEYLEYYSEQGFEFEEAEEVNDIPKYFESRIHGPDKAHYLVKEAHSDGDEKNLFRMSTKGKILKGTRVLDNGTKELIEIVYPGSDPSTTLLSNAKFGEWMKEREKEDGAELIYLNSSCWSHSKATYEIAAAKTPKLINIPTTTSMTTFTNVSLNPMYAAIDGIRKEKSYEEIRHDMKADKGYSSKSSNVMIFPDEPEYDAKIRSYVKTPISIDTKISVKKDGKEVPYSIEE